MVTIFCVLVYANVFLTGAVRHAPPSIEQLTHQKAHQTRIKNKEIKDEMNASAGALLSGLAAHSASTHGETPDKTIN
eukprot:COSAG06_NODE_1228_length_10179_cov_3.735119_14_plen_77_part_00